MKHLYSIFTFLIVAVGFSQTTIDFETGGYGADLTWTSDTTNSSFAVVDNPVSGDSTNGSDKCGAVTMATDTENWGLAYTDYEVTFTSSNATVTMDVYKPGRAVDVAIKFETADGGTNKQVIVTAGGGNAWETLSYDFSDQIDNGVTYAKIVIIPDFSSRSETTVSYFDNIAFSEGVATPDPAPTDAPTAPTESSSDVASLYSDAYTAAATVSWPNWGQPTVAAETTIASNDVYKLSSFSYQGLDFAAIDINSYSSIKVDYWTDDATQIKVKLVDYGADGVWDGNTNTESEVTHTVENTEAWNTIHLNLSDFTLDAGKIGQVVLSSDSSDRLVYVDNIYFSSTTNETPTAPSDAPSTSYSYPDANVLSIFSDYTAATYTVAGWSQATASTETIANNEVLKLASCNFYAYENYNDLDFSGVDRVEIDYWSENDTYNGGVTKIFVKLVDTDPDPVTELLIDLEPNGITSQSWQSVSINFADLDTSGIDLSSIDQIMLDNTNDGETLFIDNWIFSADQSLSTTELPIEGLSLYPNPAVDRVNVSANEAISQVRVYDLMGRVVKEEAPNKSQFSLNVSGLNKGVYMVQLKAGKKETTLKIVK